MPQRRTVLMGLAAASLLPAGRAHAAASGTPVQPDQLKTDAGDLIIQPVNHASLVLSFGSDIVYFDPVGGGDRYLAFNKPTAIMVTHAHQDHFDLPTLTALGDSAKLIVCPQVVLDQLPEGLKGKAKLMANGDKATIGEIPVEAVPAYNTTPDRLKYHPRGVGNGYVLTLGEVKVYVAGDTEDTPEMRALKGIGVAFLPMNLPFTMSGAQAASAAQEFKPLLVYPYHYGRDGKEPEDFARALRGTGAIEVRQRDWYAYG